MERIWLKHYPRGVPAGLRADAPGSLVAMLEDSFRRHRQRAAFSCLGRTITFSQVDELSRGFAAWLQAQGLGRGDRVAIMMPNVPQYPVAVVGILRAGMVVVNVNPLCTPGELEHQLKDSGAKAIVVLENFAATLQAVVDAAPTRRILVAAAGDLLGMLKGTLVNHVVRNVRKMVPAYTLPGAVRFGEALAQGRTLPFTAPPIGPNHIAVLQYTGGTTGVSKAAVLLHRNLVANLMQCDAWFRPATGRIPAGEQIVIVAALPLCHIFGFSTAMMLGLCLGGCCILVPNARDTAAVLTELARHRFHCFPGFDSLFDAIAAHPQVDRVDWSHLCVAVAGGMPVRGSTARRWLEKTGCPIVEGYGLTEASPSVTCNPVDGTAVPGTIGLPMPGTDVALLDDSGNEVPPGSLGEIAVRGPQVTPGYWQRPDETAKAMTADGFLRTGDIGTFDERGHFRIVDRKKDVIRVSGLNVYPNEVEHLVRQLDGVLDCAAVGMPDPLTGEAVKLVVVRNDPALTEDAVRYHCETHLSGFQRPKAVEFCAELPRTPSGKVRRRELRDAR